MAYVLRRGGHYLHAPYWERCFHLGVAFGWNPAGTSQSEFWEDDWSGSYFGQHTQFVDKDDAQKLSKALLRAIDCISGRKELTAEQKRVVEEISADVAGLTQVRILAGALEIADYARDGWFEIS